MKARTFATYFQKMPDGLLGTFRACYERLKELCCKDKDHRVFTSVRLGDDGQWFTGLAINYQRKP